MPGHHVVDVTERLLSVCLRPKNQKTKHNALESLSLQPNIREDTLLGTLTQ